MISKKRVDEDMPDFLTGEVMLIDKNAGITSFGVISRLRRILNIRKIGHAGTLDPFATGLLILASGKKTKEIYKYQNLDKTYSGTITLGIVTPSMDNETEPVETNDYSGVTVEQIEKVKDTFLGELEQIPPMYSALKHKGKALYKYARKGVEIEREPRKIVISKFEITKIDLPDIQFEIECSKGTYIRVIADDFGKALGCGGYLKSLRRNKIGEYDVNDAYTIDEFEKLFSKTDL